MKPAGAVSVITPVGPRWQPGFLTKAAEVLVRNSAVAEWIVVCDGSDPDHVRAVLGDDERVRVLGGTQNRGTPDARNIGLAASSTPWIYALDADDVPLDSGVDALLAAAVKRDTVWAAGLGYDVDAAGEQVVYVPSPELAPFTDTIPRGGFLDQFDVTGVYPVLCSGATLISTAVAREAGGWDETLRHGSEDVSLVAWVSERHEAAWCDDYVMAYRKHRDSRTANPRDAATLRASERRVRERARHGL